MESASGRNGANVPESVANNLLRVEHGHVCIHRWTVRQLSRSKVVKHYNSHCRQVFCLLKDDLERAHRGTKLDIFDI